MLDLMAVENQQLQKWQKQLACILMQMISKDLVCVAFVKLGVCDILFYNERKPSRFSAEAVPESIPFLKIYQEHFRVLLDNMF